MFDIKTLLWIIITFSIGECDYKIAVLVENNLVDQSLVDRVIAQRGSQDPIVTASVININNGDSVTAIQQLCLNTLSLWGIVALGRTEMTNALQRQTDSLNIPYVEIPSTPLPHEYVRSNEDPQNPLRINWMEVADANADVVKSNNPHVCLIIFEDSADQAILHRTVNSLWNHTITLKMLKMSDVQTDGLLVTYFQTKVKAKIHNIFTMTTEANIQRLLIQGNFSKINEQNYFWVIFNNEIIPRNVLPHLKSYSNVAFVRGLTFPSSGMCPSTLRNIFSTCDVTRHKYFDVKLVTSLDILLNAITIATSANMSSTISANCTTGSAFDLGSYITEQVKNLSWIEFNKSSSASVEVIATVTREQPLIVTTFERTALWSSGSKFRWTTGNDRYIRLFPNTFLGWKNRTIVICAPPVSPYLWYDGPGPIYHLNQTNGMMKEILEYIIPKLQITPIVRIAADNKWGGAVEGSEIFNGCVGELQLGLATIGASVFTYTEARSQVVDYIFPLFDDANNVLLQIPSSDGGIWNVYRPLNYYVWLLIVVMIGVASFTGFCLAKYSPVSAYNLGLPFAIRDEIYPQEHLWNIMGSFLQQGQDFYPFAPSARAVLGVWWLFTLIIFSAYTADLTSFLTIQTTVREINSLDDLAAQSRVVPYLAQGTNIDSLLKNSNIPVYKKLNKMKIYAKDATECGQAILKPENAHLACFMDYTGLLYLAKNFCQKVYLLPDLFNNAPVGWIAPKDAYYFKFVQFHMQRMAESGLIDIWFTKNFIGPGDQSCGSSSGQEAPSLNLSGVGGCFIISYTLFGMGIIFLLFELFWNRVLNRSTREFPGFR